MAYDKQKRHERYINLKIKGGRKCQDCGIDISLPLSKGVIQVRAEEIK